MSLNVSVSIYIYVSVFVDLLVYLVANVTCLYHCVSVGSRTNTDGVASAIPLLKLMWQCCCLSYHFWTK